MGRSHSRGIPEYSLVGNRLLVAVAADRGRSEEVEVDQAYELAASRKGWVHWQGEVDIALGVHRPGGGSTSHIEGEVACAWGEEEPRHPVVEARSRMDHARTWKAVVQHECSQANP